MLRIAGILTPHDMKAVVMSECDQNVIQGVDYWCSLDLVNTGIMYRISLLPWRKEHQLLT